MQLTRTIIVWLALCGIVCAEGLRNRFGIYTNGQTLATGRVAVGTNDNTFYVGNSTSNAVKVGDAAWSNSVTASVTNGLATTGFVNSAVSGLTTNLGFLDLSTNACTLYVTNGLIKGVTTP
jgi:hypothetical protein